VKGVAGNIGVESVQSAAAKVERGIKDGDPSVPALLTGLESALGPQVAAIRRALAGSAPQATAAGFNAEAASAAVERLKTLIEANDGDAADAVQAVAETLAGRVDAQRIGGLRAAISEFDFEKAALKLKEIALECDLIESSTK
jgi:ABC-type transporter Mla subunit MlaD